MSKKSNKSPKFVQDRDKVYKNIDQFHEDVNSDEGRLLQEKLSSFVAWYAYERNGQWVLAPSKYIGYEHMNMELYFKDLVLLDGRKTEEVLRPWFEEATDSTKNSVEDALQKLLGTYGKLPNSRARILIPRSDETLSNGFASTSETVSAMLVLYKQLSDAEQAEFRRRLKAV